MDQVPGTPYKILQSDKHFKYGVDSIVLSSFAQMKKGSRLADLGSGVGILALRSLYLYDLDRVYAYEIQEDLASLIEESAQLNGLEDRLIVEKKDLRQGIEAGLDYIITNPPYIEEGRGISNLSPAKEIAFHEKFLKLEDIFVQARKSLKARGRLFMVNRANRLVDVMEEARKARIEPVRLRMVQSYPASKPKFFLVEFVKDGGKNFVIESPLAIYKEEGVYSDELIKLYQEP